MACLLFLAAFPNRSFALDRSQPFSSYLQTHFTPGDGSLPSGIVDDIVQSRDGFLWLTRISHRGRIASPGWCRDEISLRRR